MASTNALSALLTRVGAFLGLQKGHAAWTMDGLIPYSWPLNYWQCGRDPFRHQGNAAVEACVSAISQSVAMMPAGHWRELPEGGKVEVFTSPAHRVLRRPNAYQTRAEFVVNMLRAELFTGNAYAWARRDDRFQITELHQLPSSGTYGHVAPDNGELFYELNRHLTVTPFEFDEPFDTRRFAPARDVLHMRLHADCANPLQGQTPIASAALAIAAGNAIAGHNAGFFSNMSRPSGFLTTKELVNPAQMQVLREDWRNATTGGNVGGTPFLSGGVQWVSQSLTASDAALIDSYRLTVADIARAFRVPLAVIGELGGATYSNTETLIRHWIATGLGYVIEHLEQALDYLFRLPDGEWIEFDTEYLLRSEFLARIDGLTRGIGGGLYAPNEARAKEGLKPVEGGDTVYVQQQLQRLEQRAQNVPLDAGREPAPPPESDKERAALIATEVIRRIARSTAGHD